MNVDGAARRLKRRRLPCWHHGMSQHVRLTPLEIIPVTLPQFQWVMGQLGWALVDLPMKLPGFTDYYYRIAKGDGASEV